MRGQGKALAALLCAALAISASLAGVAGVAPTAKAKPAQAGKLDPGFGSGGRVLASYTGKGGYGAWVEAAPSPGGATVVADGNRLLRFLPDGRLDSSFGTGGVAQVFDPPGYEFEPSALDVDSQGRPVLFGTAVNSDPASAVYFEGYAPSVERPRFAMIQRYTPAGALDPGFNGDGVIQTDFGLPKLQALGSSTERQSTTIVSVTTGAVDPADRPVLVAARGDYISPCEGHSHVGEVDTLISRINTDGQFDPTFGAGTSVVQLGPGIAESADLAFGADGGPIVLGSRPPFTYPCKFQAAVLRMDVAGNPYAPYGRYGLRYLPVADPRDAEELNPDVRPRSLALDRGGRVVVLAGPQVFRLGMDGRRDPTFGEKGTVTVNLPGVLSRLTTVGIDPRGRILLAGDSFPKAKAGPRRRTFTALRLRASGATDPSFGRGGRVFTGFGAETSGRSLSGYVDGAGRLLNAGWASGPGLGQAGSIGLVRYLGG